MGNNWKEQSKAERAGVVLGFLVVGAVAAIAIAGAVWAWRIALG